MSLYWKFGQVVGEMDGNSSTGPPLTEGAVSLDVTARLYVWGVAGVEPDTCVNGRKRSWPWQPVGGGEIT